MRAAARGERSRLSHARLAGLPGVPRRAIRMRLTLAVPELAAVDPAALAAVPALARLAAFAGGGVRHMESIAIGLLDAAGLQRDTPPAPIAARGAGVALDAGDVQHADPVTFVAGRDDILLTGRVDDLAAPDALELAAMLDTHFAADGLTLRTPRPDAWFLASRDVPLAVTTPLPGVVGPIAPHMPRGEHARHWRRWLSEMQMLLHEHPVNARRERAGRAPVNGLWLWGGGSVSTPPAVPALTIFAPAGVPGDLARGLAAARGAAPPPPRFSALPLQRDVLAVLPAIASADALPALARDWLGPAVAALEAGELTELVLLADDRHAYVEWRARRPTWWDRTRRRWSPAPFVLPPDVDTP
jgi:hypothetical protein